MVSCRPLNMKLMVLPHLLKTVQSMKSKSSQPSPLTWKRRPLLWNWTWSNLDVTQLRLQKITKNPTKIKTSCSRWRDGGTYSCFCSYSCKQNFAFNYFWMLRRTSKIKNLKNQLDSMRKSLTFRRFSSGHLRMQRVWSWRMFQWYHGRTLLTFNTLGNQNA